MSIDCICALTKIKKLKDNSQDIIFSDIPYLLGSTVKIGKDGKPYYEKARDFMNAWDGKQVDEKFWEEFFFEANRVLKFGGRILFFGIDRQLFLFQYYAVAAGFEIKQSLYWYFISNFPKATDLSKQIDKRNGRNNSEAFGEWLKKGRIKQDKTIKEVAINFLSKNGGITGCVSNWEAGNLPTLENFKILKKVLLLDDTYDKLIETEEAERELLYEIKQRGNANTETGFASYNGCTADTEKITESNTELGKKYEGYKYSISPLKQVLETVMVFQKRTKNKSILDDVFAFENGDKTISPSIWAIDSGRVPTSESLKGGACVAGSTVQMDGFDRPWMHDEEKVKQHKEKCKKNVEKAEKLGRYPSQMFIDSTCASKIDEQSGELTGGTVIKTRAESGVEKNPNGTYGTFNKINSKSNEKDSGGASRILHHIGYLDEELDLVFYSPKVSTFEREHGCGDIEKKEKVFNGCSDTSSLDIKGVEEKFTTAPTSNNHPTLKPIKLIYQIAKLLKAPFPQNVFFPFSGAGSEIIGFEQAGFDKELFSMSELDAEFVSIAETRRKAWRDMDINNLDENKKHIEKRSKEHEKQRSLF